MKRAVVLALMLSACQAAPEAPVQQVHVPRPAPVPIAAHPHADIRPWSNCVGRILVLINIHAGDPDRIADVAAAPCRSIFPGLPGQDLTVISTMVREERREYASREPEIVVGKPQALPPAVKRY